MKITKEYLKKIINEELNKLNEVEINGNQEDFPPGTRVIAIAGKYAKKPKTGVTVGASRHSNLGRSYEVKFDNFPKGAHQTVDGYEIVKQ